ncbi:MAG: AI-2E family transporter [Chitinophagaceae bacterium]|nr:AI-2E family transporter [Chitinophagaceae bacterium]
MSHNSPTSIYGRLVNPLLCIALIIWLLYVGQGVLKPFALAGLLAILLIAPCTLFEKAGFHRGIAALMSVLLAVVFFTILFYVLSTSIISFKNDWPVLLQRLREALQDLQVWAKTKFNISTERMDELINSSTSDALPSTSYIINRTFNTVSSTIFLTIVILIYTFLLLLYRRLILQFFIELFNKKHTERINNIASNVKYAIKGYLVGLVIEMIIIAVLNFLVFFILGVKYAFLLAVISAIFNIIPYLGIFMACVVSALITFTTNSAATVWGVIISLIIIHMIDTNFLMPKIVGSRVKLNALAAIFGVIAISAVWGLAGTFLAIPILAVLKAIFDQVDEWKPFALIMGDDTTVSSASGPVIKKIANKVRRQTRR